MNESVITLRPVGPDDARLLFDWANDPLVRAMAFHTESISWEEHLFWLQKKLTDPNCLMSLASAAGRPVGQIRFDLPSGRDAEVDVHTAPAARGRGLGPLIIRAGADDLFTRTHAERITAIVKCGNKGSIAAFLKAGFEKSSDCFVHDVDCERLILRRG